MLNLANTIPHIANVPSSVVTVTKITIEVAAAPILVFIAGDYVMTHKNIPYRIISYPEISKLDKSRQLYE